MVAELRIRYHMGIDGISLFFVILSTFLTPICVLASWNAITRSGEGIHDRLPGPRDLDDRYLRALDFVMFYIFFEAVLIPMFIIIGVWGGPRGSMRPSSSSSTRWPVRSLLLAALLALYFEVGTTDIPTLDRYRGAAGNADLAVARFLCLLCGQDADVAGSYMVA